MVTFSHEPVLLRETVQTLDLSAGDIAIDCTAGGGGHLAALVTQVGPKGHVYGVDRDPEAVAHLRAKFESEMQAKTLTIVHDRFSHLRAIAEEHQLIGKVAGIIADLGVSSHQLGSETRGFSFQFDGPLDMRMDMSSDLTAADIVNQWDETELSKLFWQFGEEPFAKRIARRIVAQRELAPIETTGQLSQLVAAATPYQKSKSKKNPATKVFQALRIVVNGELDEAQALLHASFEVLKPGGHLGIITFHSLEDRLVKTYFKQVSTASSDRILAKLPIRAVDETWDHVHKGLIIKPFPISPTSEEIQRNTRSRSAKLRVIKKVF